MQVRFSYQIIRGKSLIIPADVFGRLEIFSAIPHKISYQPNSYIR